ncbi:MAG: flagellar hook-length control protein FliK [Desulfovibrionaceae bacterium]|nr:flagellar hook-length control protein FliK [Desulfovibrionaceae bacterium]MBF0514029.1 flagellar hook-length control protein FliK [Desulfovibrionaceae bacterium]
MLLQPSQAHLDGILSGMGLLHSGAAAASSSPFFAGILQHQLQLASGVTGAFGVQGAVSGGDSGAAQGKGANQSAGAPLHSVLAQTAAAGATPQFNLHQLQMTQEDFASLTPGLSKLGFTDQEISDLGAKIGSDQGLTWGQFGQAVRTKTSGQSTPDTFSADEKLRLSSLLNKLGFSPTDAQKAVDGLQLSGPQAALASLLQNPQAAAEGSAQQKGSGSTSADSLLGGSDKSFWSSLPDKLNPTPQNQSVSVSQSEFASLAKAMSLPTQVTDAVAKLYAANGGKDVPLSQIKDALAQSQGQNGQASGSGDSLLSFKQLVNQTVDTAQERAAIWAQSSSQQNPAGQPDAKEYKREVVRTVEKVLSSFESGPDGPKATQSAAAAAQGQAKNQQGQPAAQSATQNAAPGAKSQVNGPNLPSQPGAQNPGNELSQGFTQNQGKNSGYDAKSGESALAKAVQTAENSSVSALKNEFQGLMAQPQTAGTGGAAGTNSTSGAFAGSSPGAENFSRAEALEQVQNGILRNLGQGTKQLTLELTPENLGKLNIVLQVRNSELTATIKSDNAETSHILNQNLAQLKDSLEQQGLTVAKLDVQTSLAENGMSSNWSGQDAHNESQTQRETMRQNLVAARMGQLGGDGLAQDMQSMGNGAIISHTGLDIFA